MNTGEIVEYQVLKENVSKIVDELYSQGTGSISKKRILVPSGVRAICFSDTKGAPDFDSIEFEDVKSLMQVLYSQNNVFYSYLGDAPEGIDIYYNVPHLKPAKNPLCFDTSGELNAFWENKGLYVEVK